MKIALTQRVLYHKGRAYDSIEHGWYRYLKEHTLIFVPNRLDQDFQKIADECDCLIITGGDDSTIRRTTELKLAKMVMALYKPVLGVCHGAFLLTDVLGGTVAQVDGHADTEHPVHYNGKTFLVNSHHSQTITRLHSSATCLTIDDQGNCESWIDGNLAGVVWHPERMQDPWLPTEIANLVKFG
jgi:gamma-glutamyl-gamma-aminobutyrate hydrolase PuuD